MNLLRNSRYDGKREKFIRMIRVHAAAVKNINSAVGVKNSLKQTFTGSCPESISKYKKEGEAMVELDQFKVTLTSYETPLAEVRDSL